jgi:two-component system cell cycle sensor histidine kinase/response regulator CckA
MNSNLRLLVGSSSIVAVTVSLALWLISGPGSTLGWVKSVALVLVLSAGSAALLGQLVRHLAAERLNQLISHLQAIDRDGDYRLRSQLAGSDEVAQAAAHLDSIFARVLQQLSDVALERSKLEARLEACELRLVKEVEQRQMLEADRDDAVAAFEKRVRERTEELSRANEALVEEVSQRTQAEGALREFHVELEERVQERTFELALANEMLVKEIEDRRQAEGERQKLVSLVENANDFIALVSLEGQITFLNDAGRKLLGLKNPIQNVALRVDQIEGESSKGAFRDIILRSVVAQGAWMGEIELLSSDPEPRRVAAEVSAVLVRDHENHRPLCVALIMRDITDRRLAEAALHELEERFSKAFHASPASVAIISLAGGRFIDVNRRFLSSLGYEEHEVVGKTMDEIHLWLASESQGKLLEQVEVHRSVRDFQCRWLTRSGEARDVQISAEPLELRRENCVLMVAEDTTERLKLEDQLRQSQKMEAVGQLAAGIAHDFNNILTVVQGHASLLLNDQVNTEKSSESIKCVSSAAERAANLTRQLLTFSRKQVGQWREVDLNSVVHNLSNMLRSLITENINLSVHCYENLPPVRGDVNMLEQVILNLVVNARDAMPKGGTLVIDTSIEEVTEEGVRDNPKGRPGRFVCLTVMDSGCGMDEATLERIFEPFFTTKEFGQGTGLGLATVYGVVTQHNGWIDVTSQPGNGTLFRIFIPALALPPTKKPDPHVESPAEIRGGSETVLVVEDELGLRMLVEAVLQKYGYNVVLAEHGPEALELWDKHPGKIDLLLTDMVMPQGLTGLELSEKLRVKNPDLRIIYMSGYTVDFMGNEVTGIREGFNFLQKPYRPEQLVRAVRQVLESEPQPLPRRIAVGAPSDQAKAA